jgi:hypothetical protein
MPPSLVAPALRFAPTMHNRRPLLVASLALFSLAVGSPSVGSAQTVRTLTVSASILTPLFATTRPVIETVSFQAPTTAEVAQGWTYAPASTVVKSTSTVPYVLTIVALSGCSETAGDEAADVKNGEVQWSTDSGRTWHDLTATPQAMGGRVPTGRQTGVHTVQYRRRVHLAVSTPCVLHTAYTAVPAR